MSAPEDEPFTLPAGLPRLADARGVAGFTAGREGRYLHLTDGAAWFASEKTARPDTLRLVDANARLDDWQRSDRSLSFRLKGYVPLEFSLAGIQHCTVSADGQPLTLRRHAGYDHGYYFISTFMAEHIAWHAARL